MLTKATLQDIDMIMDLYKKTTEYEQKINNHISLDGILEENFRASVARELLLSDFYYIFYKENDEIL